MAETLQFLRPDWLWLLLAAPLVWWLLRRRAGDQGAWARIMDSDLLEALGFRPGEGRRVGWASLGAAAWVVASIAAAGPSFRQQPELLYRKAGALVVLLDLSRSMLAGDLQPSRLERARYKLIDLLQRLREGQVALVAYAGEPFIVSPLTDDANTVRSMVGALDPGIMPAAGSEADEALALAAELLARTGSGGGHVLVIADGVNAAALERARELAGRGIRVSALGVGTPEGAPVPLPEGGVLTAADGRIVVPQLEEAQLQRLASLGGGRYARLSTGTGDLDRLLGAGWLDAGGGLEAADQDRARWRDEGPWLVLLLLPLGALAFRRGALLTLAAGLGLASAQPPARAAPLDGVFKNREQQAAAALASGDYERAATLAEDPLRRGNALYRAGDYAAAARAFAAAEGADADYNLGNSLARSGNYEQALAAYDRAMEQRPGFDDARYNRELVEQLLEQQRQEQQGEEGEEPSEQQPAAGENSAADGPSEEQAGEQGEQAQPGEQQPAGEAQDGQGEQDEGAQALAAQPSLDDLTAEEQQAMEQWLRRIPDDPGGLLRRKFLLEYQRRGSPQARAGEDW